MIAIFNQYNEHTWKSTNCDAGEIVIRKIRYGYIAFDPNNQLVSSVPDPDFVQMIRYLESIFTWFVKTEPC